MNSPTIAVVLAQFLAEQEQRLAPKTVTQSRDVVELLQEVGWTVSGVIGRSGRRWQLLEAWNVYLL